MKRLIPLFVCIALLLTGCAPLGASRRELSELLLIQTLGIDAAYGTVLLSAGAKADDSAPPLALTSRGVTVAEALDSLHNSAYADELFFHQTQRVLIGERTAAKGISEHLSYICQSPEVRLGVPIYIIEGSSANEFVTSVVGDNSGVSAVLDAIETENRRRGIAEYSAADIARSMAHRASALACAVKMQDTEDGEAPTAVFSGYGVLKEGTLRGFIGTDKLCGLGILLGSIPLWRITVKDMYGADVTVELSGGRTAFTPEFDGNILTALNIACEVEAAVSEISGSGSLSADGYALFLEKQLEAALMAQARDVLRLSQELNSDFTGLSERIELAAPMKFRRIEGGFPAVFPGLTVALSVKAAISHSNDIGD